MKIHYYHYYPGFCYDQKKIAGLFAPFNNISDIDIRGVYGQLQGGVGGIYKPSNYSSSFLVMGD